MGPPGGPVEHKTLLGGQGTPSGSGKMNHSAREKRKKGFQTDAANAEIRVL